MALTIAVIGSELFTPRIQELETKFPELRFYYYTYSDSKEAREIVQQLPVVDALFFAGTFPYHYAKDVVERRQIPSYVMRQDEAIITATLLHASWMYQVSATEISIDLTVPALFSEVLNELSSTVESGPVLQIYPEISLDSVLQFHMRAQDAQKTKIAITSIHSVHQALEEAGYKSLYMRELTETLHRAISQTAHLAKLVKSQKAEPAVVLVRNPSESKDLNDALRQFLKSPWFSHDKTTLQFLTTRKHIEYVLHLFEFRELIERHHVQVGVGYGLDTLTATRHAEDALGYGDSGTIFVMDAQKNLTTPFTSEKLVLQLTQPRQVELAKKMAMSPANLSKVIRFHALHPSNQFTASDLEKFLGLTRRSTERMIKKLVDHQLIVRSGEEMTYQQGRPRTVYTFQLPDYLLESE